MEIQDRIIEVASHQFFRFGVRSVTMDDLARELGISKKTIYQHFPDKETLINEVAKRTFTEERCKSESISRESQNPVHEIVNAAKQIETMFASMHPALMFDLQKYHPVAWSLYLQHKKWIIEIIQTNLRTGIQQGLYRADIDTDLLARLRVEVVEIGFRNDLFPFDKYPLIQVHKAFLDHYMRGILTPEGLTLYEELNQ